MTCLETWLVIAPLLSVFVILLMLLFLRMGGYKISDALRESTTASPPSAAPASASRLIAFITGITTLLLVLCLTSFWIYQTIKGNPVDLSKVSTLFLSLGLGVVPYGVNKISKAVSQSSDKS